MRDLQESALACIPTAFVEPMAASTSTSSSAAESYVVAASLRKPAPPGVWRRKRVFMGIAWGVLPNAPAQAARNVGVPISQTFLNMPTCGRLFGGDVIISVNGEAVNAPVDVVHHWETATQGILTFEVRRTETHRYELGQAAIDALRDGRLSLRFDQSTARAPAPIVAYATTSLAQLSALQQQGWPMSGDLILAVGRRPVATAAGGRVCAAYRHF